MNNKAASLTPEQALAELEARYEASVTALRKAIGDYIGGPNHVLPTARSARFSSGLGVLDFMKRTSILKVPPAALRQIGPAAITLAEVEGLGGHAAAPHRVNDPIVASCAPVFATNA